ncbi:MAG: hypothetical protein Kow00129_05260 [Thermoleophilia bacterium]
MAEQDPIFEQDREKREPKQAEDLPLEERMPKPYDEGLEPGRAVGGLYLLLIILAIIVLALALVAFFL